MSESHARSVTAQIIHHMRTRPHRGGRRYVFDDATAAAIEEECARAAAGGGMSTQGANRVLDVLEDRIGPFLGGVKS